MTMTALETVRRLEGTETNKKKVQILQLNEAKDGDIKALSTNVPANINKLQIAI